jgi:LacI family gluconate utilization system Gnt-I transcriptional repressor
VHKELVPAGFQPLIGVTHYDADEEELLLRSWLPHRPAGLLVTGFDRSEKSRQLITQSGVPCVHLMEISAAKGVHCVGFSQADAGAAITDHLLQRGRKRIAFCAAQLDPRTLQRAEGFRKRLREAELYDPQIELLSPERSSIALGARMFEKLLRDAPDIDAIFFCNDDIAQGGLLAANRLGIKVPDRIAVAGFNDLAGSDQMLPPLTSVRTPRGEVGTEGARMLMGLMRGEEPASSCVRLNYELVVRGST